MRPENESASVSCPVAFVRRGLKRQWSVYAVRAGASLLQALHLQKDTRRVSKDIR